MKRISTLGFGILCSIASFAGYAPSRLTVSTDGNCNIKVTVDDSRFNQQNAGNSAVFDNLEPGFHAVKIYQLEERHFGFFGRRRSDYRLVYSSSVNIRPMVSTSIALNRFGGARINEQPLRDVYNDGGWNRHYGYGNDDDGRDRDHHDADWSRNNDYVGNNDDCRLISKQDFFAAERVMDRENDNGRSLYARQVVDENYLTAEQVKELARFFSFDDCRLDFVKYAYRKTVDKNNFSVVCNAFVSGSGRDQLMNFIRNCR